MFSILQKLQGSTEPKTNDSLVVQPPEERQERLSVSPAGPSSLCQSLSPPPSNDVLSETSSSYKKEVGVPAGFHIPTSWRAEIMDSIKSKEMTPKARNALV